MSVPHGAAGLWYNTSIEILIVRGEHVKFFNNFTGVVDRLNGMMTFVKTERDTL